LYVDFFLDLGAIIIICSKKNVKSGHPDLLTHANQSSARLMATAGLALRVRPCFAEMTRNGIEGYCN